MCTFCMMCEQRPQIMEALPLLAYFCYLFFIHYKLDSSTSDLSPGEAPFFFLFSPFSCLSRLSTISTTRIWLPVGQ